MRYIYAANMKRVWGKKYQDVTNSDVSSGNSANNLKPRWLGTSKLLYNFKIRKLNEEHLKTEDLYTQVKYFIKTSEDLY